jgi:hypothetical protein
MSGPRASPRPRHHHLKPGTAVQHQTFGTGRVIAEWGPIAVDVADCGLRSNTSCEGIYDVEFGVKPRQFPPLLPVAITEY